MSSMLFALEDGRWFDFPGLAMAGADRSPRAPRRQELIPLPAGATLTMMPGLAPVGLNKADGSPVVLSQDPYGGGGPVYALAALLPQGFTRLLCPATEEKDLPLPLLGYTAVGMEKGRLVVAARQTDEHKKWHPRYFNTPELARLTEERIAEFPDNRLIRHLAHCALEYGCFTAQNIFYRRWEGGIPASPVCNAQCLGCISLQPSQCCPSPQQRIAFRPHAEEIAEIALAHLRHAADAIVSFGQGCEGEPSLNHTAIAEAIRRVRRQTRRGSFNINTNAGDTQAIHALLEAGMDSLRVSMFSPLPEEYAAYHRPCGYGLAQVRESLLLAKEYRRPASLNLLVYPGFSDDPRRLDALTDLVGETGVAQIQLRNLNCGPALMTPFLADSQGMGMLRFIEELGRRLPQVQIGSYTHAGQNGPAGVAARRVQAQRKSRR
ncbi:MAG: radical SAM protein [Firmicutes bacterium]|nr:radical SAM protein [Bacillota bacterium]